MAIARRAQQMSEALLVRITGKRVYNDLEFEEDQKDHRELAQKKLVTFHEDSIAIMRQTYEVFKNDGSEVRRTSKYLLAREKFMSCMLEGH